MSNVHRQDSKQWMVCRARGCRKVKVKESQGKPPGLVVEDHEWPRGRSFGRVGGAGGRGVEGACCEGHEVEAKEPTC